MSNNDIIVFFFFNDTATTEIYTLSLHDALPIYWAARRASTSRSSASATHSGPASRPLPRPGIGATTPSDRKSTRLNSSHANISYAVFCLKKKKKSTIYRYTHTYISHETSSV